MRRVSQKVGIWLIFFLNKHIKFLGSNWAHTAPESVLKGSCLYENLLEQGVGTSVEVVCSGKTETRRKWPSVAQSLLPCCLTASVCSNLAPKINQNSSTASTFPLTCIPGTSMVTSTFFLLQLPVFFFFFCFAVLFAPVRKTSPLKEKRKPVQLRGEEIFPTETGLFVTEWRQQTVKSNCDSKKKKSVESEQRRRTTNWIGRTAYFKGGAKKFNYPPEDICCHHVSIR